MFRPTVGTELQNRQNGHNYYKVFVYGSDGKMVRGSRTLRSFTGRRLKQVVSDYQIDINAGLWDRN